MPLPLSRFHRALNAGLKSAAQQRFDEAIEHFERAIRIDPKDPRAYLQSGLALSEAGKYEQSVEALEKAAALAPGEAIFPLFLGVVHLDHDRLEPAQSSLEKAVSLDKQNALAKNYSALCRWKAGEKEAAVRALLDIDFIQSPPFEARLLAAIESARSEPGEDGKEGADGAEGKGGTDGAGQTGIDLPEDILPKEREPFFPFHAWIMRRRKRQAAGQVKKAGRLAVQERFESVLYLLEAAWENDPYGEECKQARERVCRQSLKILQKRIKKKGGDKDSDLAYYAGCFCELLGTVQQAGAYFESWLEGRPEGDAAKSGSLCASVAWRVLCEAALESGKAGRAADCLKKLQTLDPGDPYIQYLEGRCRLLEGDPKAAQYAFERMLDKEPATARMKLRTLIKKES